ncbi:MAG: hypothetical protein ACTH17_11175, partial [Staphylococcus equorum]
FEIKGETQSSDTLPKVRLVDADFESLNETPISINTDLVENMRTDTTLLGPIESLQAGENKVLIWKRAEF